MPSHTAPDDLPRTLLRGLAARYARIGYERSGVTPLSALAPDVEASALRRSVEYLQKIEAVFASDRGMVLLAPALRIHLVTPFLLDSWRRSIATSRDNLEISESRRRARDELHALTAYAYAVGDGLPVEDDESVAEVAALLACPGLNLDALDVAAAHPGGAHAKFRYLVRLAPESVPNPFRLRHLLESNVSREPQARAVKPLPPLGPMLEALERGRRPAWKPLQPAPAAVRRGVAVAVPRPRHAAVDGEPCCDEHARAGHRHRW